MALTTAELTLVEARVANETPSTGAAYVLWFFLWFVSAHRFYLGKPGTAILQILSYFVLVGFVWVLIDAFLIPGMIRDKQNQVRSDVMTQLAGYPA
jgi:TM2 domain-containing membrane protein YozV